VSPKISVYKENIISTMASQRIQRVKDPYLVYVYSDRLYI